MQFFSSLSLLALLGASITTALPTELTNFLLVTSTDASPNTNSSNLKAVSATSLFRAPGEPSLILRLIGPGYNSLPNFTLTDGTLSTYSAYPQQIYYNSSHVEAKSELEFEAKVQTGGNIALDDAYLLTVDGEKEGWTVCDGPVETEVLFWKGEDAGCESVYLRAVTGAPY